MPGRRPAARLALVMLMATGGLLVVRPPGVEAGTDAELVERGRELYVTGCSSCHGLRGQGLTDPDGGIRGPSLLGAGEAAAHYYLSTGRMPLANAEQAPRRKDPAYSPEEIEALVAYVGSIGDGIPLSDVRVDPAEGDLAVGGEIFRADCAPCHSAAGAGGALSYGRSAPQLAAAEPLEIAAAMRVGPGEMPVFGPNVIDDEELDSVVRYVEYLEDPADPGGLAFGRVGPVPEGLVTWLGGVVALLLATAWIGKRRAQQERT